MRTLKIDVSDSIYEHIIFFLKSLPTNLIKISDEKEIFDDKKSSKKEQIEELFRTYSDTKAFKNIDNPIDWQKGLRDEWK